VKWLALIVSVGLLSSCASKADLESAQSLLEECRNDKSLAQEDALSCQDRYDSEVRRWQDTDALLAEVLPRTMEDVRTERDRIIELIPAETRQEVEGYLDELSDGMARGFQVLREENETVFLQREIAQTKLDVLADQTDSIGEEARSITALLDGALEEQQERALATRRAIAGVVERIHVFDKEFIYDRDSKERLRLSRNQRETIKGFPDDVVGILAALQE